MNKQPPFQITSVILNQVKEISHKVGVLSGAKLTQVPIQLRRENQIKTIQSSLAIEGNSLNLEQITDIINGKRVIGKQQDIQEVINAIQAYNNLSQWNPISIQSLKKAHRILMQNLVKDNGQWRMRGIGVFKGKEAVHIAPPAKRVPDLMEDLFKFVKANNTTPWLIKACIFHYELEFIHPFSDGNGRIGRLWQQLLLMKEDPIFEFVPVESIIRLHQQDYYNTLAVCDKAGESTAFIEFSLEQILTALKGLAKSIIRSEVIDPTSRLKYAQMHISNSSFTRKDYCLLHKDISTATASRDLLHGLEIGMLTKNGDKNQARYSFTPGTNSPHNATR